MLPARQWHVIETIYSLIPTCKRGATRLASAKLKLLDAAKGMAHTVISVQCCDICASIEAKFAPRNGMCCKEVVVNWPNEFHVISHEKKEGSVPIVT